MILMMIPDDNSWWTANESADDCVGTWDYQVGTNLIDDKLDKSYNDKPITWEHFYECAALFRSCGMASCHEKHFQKPIEYQMK